MDTKPGPLDHEAFQAHMRPFTDQLARFAVAARDQPETFHFVPAHDSTAMAELDAEKRWSVPEWLQPARNAHSYGLMLTYYVAEHVAGFAAIVDRIAFGPAFAQMALVRSVMESAPVAHWLLDPTIGVETRIRRSIAYRLDSINQQGRLEHIPNVVETTGRLRDECRAFAAHHGWPIDKGQVVGGEQVPRSGVEFSRVAFGSDDAELDPTLWNMASAMGHGTWYALADGLKERVIRNDPLDPHGGLAPIAIQARNLYALGLMVFHGLNAVTTACSQLMGWDPSDDMVDSRRQLTDFSRQYAADMRAQEAASRATADQPMPDVLR